MAHRVPDHLIELFALYGIDPGEDYKFQELIYPIQMDKMCSHSHAVKAAATPRVWEATVKSTYDTFADNKLFVSHRTEKTPVHELLNFLSESEKFYPGESKGIALSKGRTFQMVRLEGSTQEEAHLVILFWWDDAPESVQIHSRITLTRREHE